MGKAKVKKFISKNQKEAKQNPFNLRFNKVKHKIVNERNQTRNSNPYQSRSRATEIRKQSLLADYKNRNKTGFVKFVNKDEITIKKDNGNQFKKSNAEYMSEMFEKKRLVQLKRDKIDNLKDKLDNQWNEMKCSFISKELAKKQSKEDDKQIDSYDLIFNDLLTNSAHLPRT